MLICFFFVFFIFSSPLLSHRQSCSYLLLASLSSRAISNSLSDFRSIVKLPEWQTSMSLQSKALLHARKTQSIENKCLQSCHHHRSAGCHTRLRALRGPSCEENDDVHKPRMSNGRRHIGGAPCTPSSHLTGSHNVHSSSDDLICIHPQAEHIHIHILYIYTITQNTKRMTRHLECCPTLSQASDPSVAKPTCPCGFAESLPKPLLLPA
jgi:hypothetical protein